MVTVKKTLKKPTITKKKRKKQYGDVSWRGAIEFWNKKQMPISSLELLADRIVDIVDNDPDIITLNRVLARCKVSSDSLRDYVEKCEKLKHARDHALLIIGINREEKALMRRIDGNIMKHMQGIYDKQWASQEERHAELRQSATPEHTTKVVVLKDFKDEK